MLGSTKMDEKVILVVGSLGLDRLLPVAVYPEADAKVRTTSYHEYGGGNAGNGASAMAKLSDATFLRNLNLKIKLLTKVGDDAVGMKLKDELEAVGVDCSSPLFRMEPNTTTSFTTIIVSESEHTRTCLHTPGTSGELSLRDVETENMDHVFDNVIHLHSDSRHTDAALALANEARKRSIPVSVDAEKDRHTRAQDQLLESATMIFTNAHQIDDYLTNLSAELEVQHNRKVLSSSYIIPGMEEELNTEREFVHVLRPSFHFARWHGQIGKEIVITKGKRGSIHVLCSCYGEAKTTHCSLNGDLVRQVVTEQVVKDGSTHQKVTAEYRIHRAGVLTNKNVVDTTGAGDVFIGAYILMAKCALFAGYEDNIELCLQFAAWVAGEKIGGHGARYPVPEGKDVDNKLGRTVETMQKKLKEIISNFR